MFDAAGAGRPPDRALIDLKRNVADVLGPLASGLRLAPTAGLILAADALTQDHGAPVEETGLDPVMLEPDSTFAEWMYALHTITASQVGHDVLIRAAHSNTA
jgi:sulfofructosephosphate aldolase